jgi:hypothetical protein
MRKEVQRKLAVGETVTAQERRLSKGLRFKTPGQKYLAMWKSTPNAIEIIITARLVGDPYQRRSGQVRGTKTNVNVHLKDKTGQTALHHAAAQGLKVLVSRLLDMQAKVNDKDGKHNTPLTWAVRGQAYEVVEMLLECGADVNFCNTLFDTPLHFAVDNCDKQIVSTLIKYQANPNNYNAEGMTPLIRAMSFADPFLFRGIMEAKPSMDPIDLRGWNIAIYAVRYGLLIEVVDYLRDDTEVPAEERRPGKIRLKEDIVKSLFEYQDPQGYTALHHAAIIQDPKYVDKVLELNGTCVNTRDANGNTPLHHAALHGNLHIAQVIANQVASLDVKNNFGETPLLLAAQSGNLAQVLTLTNNKVHILGASADAVDNRGRTLLMMAAIGGNLDLLNVIISQMKRPNRDFSFTRVGLNDVDHTGCSALMHAAIHGNWELVPNLAIAGANFLIQDTDGYSCLHYAAEQGEDETVLALCDGKANLDLQDAQGWTALMHAVCNANQSTTAILCDAKANIKIENFHGVSALHMANKSSQECLEHLTDRHRMDDIGAVVDPVGFPRLARVQANGHLMVTIHFCKDLWLEGVAADDLNTYLCIQLILDDNKCDNVFTVCFMGGNHPVFAETFRFTLPYVSNETKVAIHVIATKGSNEEVIERMRKQLPPTEKPNQKLQMAQKASALLRGFGRTQVNVLKERQRKKELAEAERDQNDGVIKMDLNRRRWHWINLLWGHAGMRQTPLPPVSKEDCPLGFVIVRPNTVRHAVQSCETADPIKLTRSLRGSAKGAVSFDLDFRRHYRPAEVPDPIIPCPVGPSFEVAPQPPLDRDLPYLKLGPKGNPPVPTTPWGTRPAPFPPPVVFLPGLPQEDEDAVNKKVMNDLGPAG